MEKQSNKCYYQLRVIKVHTVYHYTAYKPETHPAQLNGFILYSPGCGLCLLFVQTVLWKCVCLYSDEACTCGQLVIASRESQYKILHFHHAGLDKLAEVFQQWKCCRETQLKDQVWRICHTIFILLFHTFIFMAHTRIQYAVHIVHVSDATWYLQYKWNEIIWLCEQVRKVALGERFIFKKLHIWSN